MPIPFANQDLQNSAILIAGLAALWVWLVTVGVPLYLLPPQRERAVPWSGTEVFFAFFFSLVVITIIQALLARNFFPEVLAAKDVPVDQLTRARLGTWASSLALPFQVLTILVVFRQASGTLPYQLGLTGYRPGKNLLLGAAAWFVMIPVVLGVNLLVETVYQQWFQAPPEKHPFEGLVQGQAQPIDWVLLILSATVAAPVWEELLFRGVLQPWLIRRRWSWTVSLGGSLFAALLFRANAISAAWDAQNYPMLLHELEPALFVLLMAPGFWLLPRLLRHWMPRSEVVQGLYGTALLFAMWHTAVWPSPISLFVLALGLGWLAYRTQSLVPSIVLHGLFNAVACVTLFVQAH